ncbi:MAG: hypothetical protein IPM24_25150 [Bryobacterales bacterium]|jgi:hypothetical protein|nr:hypothetical protein [Bryobacterales bacterium]
MACPHFRPQTRLPHPTGTAPAPLGDLYAGGCLASGRTPDEATTRELCNYGYARGRCPSFQADSPADAIRFSVRDHHGGVILGAWAVEAAHRPHAWGAFRYDEGSAGLDGAPEEIASHLRVYLGSYLRRLWKND